MDITISALLKSTFNGMVNEYNKTFQYIYPSRGKRGFTERNLTSRFCKNLEHSAVGSQYRSVSWFEFPLPTNNGHIDAVVFLFGESTNSVILIEAKRVTENQYHAKNKSIKNDIDRMTASIPNIINPEYLHSSQKKISFEKYVVILADLWSTKGGAKDYQKKWTSTFPDEWKWPYENFKIEQITKLTEFQNDKNDPHYWPISPYYLLLAWNKVDL